ncbi:hypothetical protein BS78_07G092400 [Paspalum vaginatum]|nr:hypothetical protein BS78_07G092400 [Paspalum vaginatum]
MGPHVHLYSPSRALHGLPPPRPPLPAHGELHAPATTLHLHSHQDAHRARLVQLHRTLPSLTSSCTSLTSGNEHHHSDLELAMEHLRWVSLPPQESLRWHGRRPHVPPSRGAAPRRGRSRDRCLKPRPPRRPAPPPGAPTAAAPSRALGPCPPLSCRARLGAPCRRENFEDTSLTQRKLKVNPGWNFVLFALTTNYLWEAKKHSSTE